MSLSLYVCKSSSRPICFFFFVWPSSWEMATHSSTLAWKIRRTEKPGRLQSMVSQRVRHDWVTSLHFTSIWEWLHVWNDWKIKSICDMRILHKIQVSVSPNKVLSEHKHTHSGPCCLPLLSKHSSRVEELCRRAAGPLSPKYLLFGPLQKRSAESSFTLYT